MWKAFIQTVTNEYETTVLQTETKTLEKLMAQYNYVKLVTNVYDEWRYCINKLHLSLRSAISDWNVLLANVIATDIVFLLMDSSNLLENSDYLMRRYASIDVSRSKDAEYRSLLQS